MTFSRLIFRKNRYIELGIHKCRVSRSQEDDVLVNIKMDNIFTQHTFLAIISREAFGAATLVRSHADAAI